MAEPRLTRFDILEAALREEVPFRIRYKDESPEMEAIAVFVEGFSPDFMDRYTTVIGSTIYFPNRHFLFHSEEQAMRTLAHEAVHLLDAERWSMPLFSLAYLFPQILAVGVFLFPWLGIWALTFLLFLLPLPAPFRFYFESRAYALDLLTLPRSEREPVMERIIEEFAGWGYYRMFPFRKLVAQSLLHWVRKAEKGKDPILLKVLLLYEMAAEE
jgi:hypothetical protein